MEDSKGWWINNFKTYIHEQLHARSLIKGHNKDLKSIYASHRAMEEGVVEYLAQSICKRDKIPFSTSYDEYVKPLKSINSIVYKNRLSDYDFAKMLFDIPMEERYNKIESIVNQYTLNDKKYNRKRKHRLTLSLKQLESG